MFDKISLNKEFNILELITSISIIFIMYGFFYQYFFFSAVGVEWMSNLLTPNLILLTSFKIFIVSLLSVLAGYGLAMKYYLLNNDRRMVVGFVLFCVIIGVISQYFLQVSSYLHEATDGLLLILYVLASTYLFYLFFKLVLRIKIAKKQGNRYMPALIFTFLLAPFLLVFVPWKIAQTESLKVTVAPGQFYNTAVLNKDKSKWFLISVAGDKALIQSHQDKKVFKYIEIKDIEEIRVN